MSSSETLSTGPWLILSEAADYLGVHFTTLRRWADAGEVPCIRTPGGRRRFAFPELQRFLARMRQPSAMRAAKPLQTRALDLAHQHIQVRAPHQESWFARFDEQQRLQFKHSGRRLVGLLIQYSSRSDSGEAFLEEGRHLAGEYGVACCRAGLSIAETVKAFLFFRRSFLDAIHETTPLNSPNDVEGRRLYQRMSDFLDTALVETVESYCEAHKLGTTESMEGQQPCR